MHVEFHNCNTIIEGNILVKKINVKKIAFQVPDCLTTQIPDQNVYDLYSQRAFFFDYLMI